VIRSLGIFLLLVASSALASTTEIYSGTIGKNLKIRMRLSEEGEAVTGGYFYTKSVEQIKLSGTVSNGLYTLTEYDSTGTKTAQMVFSRTSDSTYSGTWYSLTKSTKSFPISLIKANLSTEHNMPHQLTFDHEPINLENKKMMYTLNATIPQLKQYYDPYIFELFNASIKHTIESEVKQTISDFKDRYKEMKETIADQNIGSFCDISDTVINTYSPFISVYLDHDVYWMGAAHPQHYIETMTFNTVQGRWITLDDLFKKGSGYLDKLAGYCYRDLKQQQIDRAIEELKDSKDTVSFNDRIKDINNGYANNSLTSGTEPKKVNYDCFTLDKDGLTIYFNEYQVASYVEGRFDVTVPWAELKDILADK